MSDDHVPERLARAIRAASMPSGGGAAETAADRAWARAAELRDESRVRRVPRIVSAAAAAVLLVSVAALSTRGAAPAFAVEGDPVQVLVRGTWRTTRTVRVGAWVHSPEGVRSILATDGGRIEPSVGALFRVLGGPGSFRVELRRGDASVSGRSMALEIAGEVDVAPAAGADAFAVRVSAPRGEAAPPAASALLVRAEGDPVIRVDRGSARIFDRNAATIRLAGPHESLLATRSLGAPTLLPLVAWNDAHAGAILRGAAVCSAQETAAGGGILALAFGGEPRLAFDIPAGEIERAADAINEAAFVRAVRADVTMRVVASLDAPRLIAEHEHGGERTVVHVGRSVRVTLPDGTSRAFPDLAAFRAAMPDTAARFGDDLR